MMVPVLAAYAVGLPFFAFVNLILRAFYARKDTATPVRAAWLSFVVNLGLSLALMEWLGTVGLAIAGNIAVVAQAAYLQRRLAADHEGLRFSHLWGDLGKIALAGAAMGGLVAGGWWAWTQMVPPTSWGDATGLVVLIGLGAGSYAGMLWAMRIKGREDIAAMWEKFRIKGR
jgi:putative peptidoglycan lipid II flippase